MSSKYYADMAERSKYSARLAAAVSVVASIIAIITALI